MKQLFLTLVLTLIGGTATADKIDSFKIRGLFLQDSKVVCEVYETTTDSFTLVQAKKSFKRYNVELETGKTYVIIFKSKNIQKLLYVNVERNTRDILIDVDFAIKRDAIVTFTKEMNHYEVELTEETKL